MLRKSLRPLLAAALLGLMRSASAIELGEIISVSRAGGALRVEIELPSAGDDLPVRSSCFTLAVDPENPSGLPVVANGRATLRTLDGRHSVIVNSNQRIGETAVLGLRMNCGSGARRDYVLQLAPEPVASTQVRLAEMPAAEMRMAEMPATEMRMAEVSAAETPQARPAERLPPKRPKRVSPRPRVADDRIEVSLTPADEALSRRMSAAAPASAPADYAAAGAVATQLDARLRELEATLASLRAEIEAANRAEQQFLAAAPGSDTGSVRLAAATPADSPLAVVPRSLKPTPGDESAYSTNWLLGIGAGATMLLLAAYAALRGWLRRRAADEPDAEVPLRGAAAPQATQTAASDADGDGHAALGAHTIEVVEPKSPLELAEFMLSFGRVDDAAMALEEHIASNPRSAIEPWQKLLGIYRQVGRRHAFEALARRMHRTFNVAAPQWEQKPDGRRAP